MSKLSYETAKRLKDSGFPQHNEHELKEAESQGGINPEYTKIPTLSELIEACDKRFGRLELVQIVGVQDVSWFAYSAAIENKLGIDAFIVKQDSTPEEAVANLWLVLNE